MKISLAGDLGSGKSTVAKILMERIGAEYYGTGLIAREIAEKYGMGIAELNIYMETHPELDHEFDDRLVALSDDPRRLIIDSRMAWHFTRDTFRIYLTVDPVVAAARIMADTKRGSVEKFNSIEEAVANNRARKESEKKRYFDLYGVDCKDLDNYDLVVDTTYYKPEEIATLIEDCYRRHMETRCVRGCYVSAHRFLYPDDAADMEEASVLADRILNHVPVPAVKAVYRDDQFYLVDGVTSVLAYSLDEMDVINCELVHQDIDPASYVKMEDNL